MLYYLLKDGSKSDRIDARKLAELLRGNHLSPIYHGENGLRTLKELARSYLTITKDLTRVMSRIKAVYRSWAIPCAGPAVYRSRHRAEWLAQIVEPGVRLRAERLYQQLDALEPLRQGARRDLLAESRKHPAVKLLRQIPYLGPIRSAVPKPSPAALESPTKQHPGWGDGLEPGWAGSSPFHHVAYFLETGCLKYLLGALIYPLEK